MTLSTALSLMTFQDFKSSWMTSSCFVWGESLAHFPTTSKLRHWLIQPLLWKICLNQLKGLDLSIVNGTVSKHYSILTLLGHFFQVTFFLSLLVPSIDYHTTRHIAHIYQKSVHEFWGWYNDWSRMTIVPCIFLIQSKPWQLYHVYKHHLHCGRIYL